MPKVKEQTATYRVRKQKKLQVERLHPRETTLNLVQRMNSNATYEDIMYGVYFLEKVDKGLQAVEEGRVLSHEEVKRRLGKWLK